MNFEATNVANLPVRETPSPGRTTKAVLFCAAEGKWNRHKFVRENRMTGGVTGRRMSVELLFACACGAEPRRWGWEDR